MCSSVWLPANFPQTRQQIQYTALYAFMLRNLVQASCGKLAQSRQRLHARPTPREHRAYSVERVVHVDATQFMLREYYNVQFCLPKL